VTTFTSGIFAFGGLFLVFAGVSVFGAIRSARWKDMAGFWKLLGLAVCFAIAGGATLWWAAEHPNLKDLQSQVLGPGWSCENYGKGAFYCSRSP
jgi:hypothetical protein